MFDNPVAGAGPFLIARRIEDRLAPDRADVRARRRGARHGRRLERRAGAVAAAGRGRPHLRPRRRRQQGPALGEPGRAGSRDRRARPPRVQLDPAVRDGGGGRFARAARTGRPAAAPAGRRRVHRLRRAAGRGAPPDAVHGRPRCAQPRAGGPAPRGRPPLGQLGWRAREPGRGAGERDRVDHRPARPCAGAGARADRHRAVGPSGARRVPIESGPGAPAVDPDWGEPGLTPDRTAHRLEHVRGARVPHGRPRPPRQRDPTDGRRPLPDPVHRRHRPGVVRPGAARAPRRERVRPGDRAGER